MLNRISVVHCKKTSEDFVYIGRPSPLGNPFKLEKGMKKGSTLEKYEDWLRERISRRDPKVCSELSRFYKLAKEDSMKTLPPKIALQFLRSVFSLSLSWKHNKEDFRRGLE